MMLPAYINYNNPNYSYAFMETNVFSGWGDADEVAAHDI